MVGEDSVLTGWRDRLAAALPVVGLVIFVVGLALRPMEETNLFFRLAVGDQIVRTGELPRRNLFSFTYPEHPDEDSAWLFDAGASLLHGAGGFAAIVVAKALVLALTFALAFRLCRRRGAGPIAAALALAGAALVMSERLVERPHVFSFAGEVAVLLLLGAAERRPSALAFIPLVAAVWANLHAGVFVAPLLLGAAACGLALERRRPAASGAGLPSSWAVLLAAVAAAGAMLLTPVGTGLLRYLAFHRDIYAIHPVDEFRPPSWDADAPLLVFVLVTAAGVAATPVRRRWRNLLPALVLALLAFRTIRFGADLALVGAPLLAQALTALAARSPMLVPKGLRARGAPGVALGLGLAAVLPRAVRARAGEPFLDVGLARAALPLRAIAFVEENGLRERMYNDFELGGYLAWQGFPRHRVFVDPRLPAYPRAFHALLGRGNLTRAEWDAALERHGVDSALLAWAGVNRRVAWWDPARWALVFREDDARVFVRRLPRWQALIAAHEVPATFSFTEAKGVGTIPLETPPPGSPVPACEWQRRLGALYFELDGGDDARALAATREALAAPEGCLSPARAAEAASWVGAALLHRGDAAGAAAALARALALGPRNPATLTNRALALEALGRPRDAATAWLEVAAAAPSPLAERARARAARLAGAAR